MSKDKMETGPSAMTGSLRDDQAQAVDMSGLTAEDVKAFDAFIAELDGPARRPRAYGGGTEPFPTYPDDAFLPTTLADHMTFPDARRELADLSMCLYPILRPLDNEEGFELTLAWDDSEAAKELRQVSERLRRFSDWLDAKLEGYIAYTDPVTEASAPIVSQFEYRIGQHEIMGYIDGVGNVCRVKSNDVWDTFVVEEGNALEDSSDGLLEDLFIHRASLGRDPYDF